MASKNKFKPKAASPSATPWKEAETGEGSEGKVAGKKTGGAKKFLFSRKSG